MKRHVEVLACLDRRTTTPGERQSAELIAAWLGEAGVSDVRFSSFRSQSSWAPVNLLLAGTGLAAAASGHRGARLIALATAGALELDASGRWQPLRRLLPAGRGVTVTARVAATQTAHKTLVLCAHHDAAQQALIWRPVATAASRALSRATSRSIPTHVPQLVAMLLAASPGRRARVAAGAVMSVSMGLIAEAGRGAATPGANDNATGVAAAIELARGFVERPLQETDVIVVFPGGEEVGSTGARRWVAEQRDALDPASTLAINLDALGSGEHLTVSPREALSARYAPRDVELAEQVAARIGVDLRRAVFANASDAFSFRRAGIRTISLMSYADGWIRGLHAPTDTVENVRWTTVLEAIGLADAIARRWAAA